jgi:uncharacterized membrane protein (DUF106 family)
MNHKNIQKLQESLHKEIDEVLKANTEQAYKDLKEIANQIVQQCELEAKRFKKKEQLKRDIKIIPAFDYLLTDEGDSKYGRSSAYMICSVEGELGKVVLEVNTKWFLPITADYMWKSEVVERNGQFGLDCTYRCWYNGASSHIFYILTNKELDLISISGSNEYNYGYVPYGTEYEQKLTDLLVHDGSDKLFDKLEEIYEELLKA